MTDIYGFRLPKLTAQQQEERTAGVNAWQSQKQRWEKYAQRQRLTGSRSRLKTLIREGGVPPDQRTWVWLELSGAQQLKVGKPNSYFENLVIAGEATSASRHQIELDLPRTFPDHAWLHGAEGRAALRATLLAYSMHNPQAGYCQGLNFVVGTLLLATDRRPETSFWLLLALTEKILFRDMYGPYLPGFLVEMKTLNELISRKLPGLHRHLEGMGCEITILATDWFMCLYVTTLPHESAIRVLDCLFCEGSKILFRVALALLKMNEKLLMQYDNAGELIPPLKESVAGCWSPDKLLRQAFRGIGGLPMARIQQYREQHRGPIERMARERESTRRAQEQQAAARAREQQQQERERQQQEGQQQHNGHSE